MPTPSRRGASKRRARPLFQRTDPLEFTLTANFNAINKDRNPESTTRYPAILTVAAADGAPRDIPVKLSARGHFRRMARNCRRPAPRRVPEGTAWPGTPFDGQTTLKARDRVRGLEGGYEQITLREYPQHPMFNLVTPLSFRARLARATYTDEKSKKKSAARYALFIEHENDVARRTEGPRRRAAAPGLQATSRQQTLTRMMLFES